MIFLRQSKCYINRVNRGFCIGLICLIVIFVAIGSTCLANDVGPIVNRHLSQDEAQAAFKEATDLCLRDNSLKCAKSYEQLVSEGWSSVELEYNLGTIYLRAGKLGPAILHLERALRLDPNDADSRSNLLYARRQRIDKTIGTPEVMGADESLLSRIVGFTSCNVWSYMFLCFWISGIIIVIVRRYFNNKIKSKLSVVSYLLIVAAVPCAIIVATHVYVRSSQQAIVLSPEIAVKEGPSRDNAGAMLKTLFQIHEGLKVRVMDTEGSFSRIRLDNGLEGWILSNGLEKIDIPLLVID